jgi:hypothetical protein
MAKFMVKTGCTLLYPDGSRRGSAGYVVDDAAGYESHALSGQKDKLEPCADYISSDSVDFVKMVALNIGDTSVLGDEPKAPAKKKAKKKTKKKAAKKASKKSSK